MFRKNISGLDFLNESSNIFKSMKLDSNSDELKKERSSNKIWSVFIVVRIDEKFHN